MNIKINPIVPQPQGCEIKLVPLKAEPWKPGLYRSTGDTDTVLFATSFNPDQQKLTGTVLRSIGRDVGEFSREWPANAFSPLNHDVVIRSTNLGDKYPQLANGPQGCVFLMFSQGRGLTLKITDDHWVYGVKADVGDLLEGQRFQHVIPFAGSVTISND